MSTEKKIKILHLEDVEIDADLVKRILIKAKMEPDIRVVEDKESYVKALIEFVPDVILSDHSLPAFNSKEALDIFLHSGKRIPFILVTGAISEEFAVSVIKSGANDYILKDNLENLPVAIVSALEKIKTQVDHENQQSQESMEKANAVFEALEFERDQLSNELLENINQILAASNLYIDCAINYQDKRVVFIENSKKYVLMAIDEIKKLSYLITPPTFGEIGLIKSLDNWLAFKQQNIVMKLITQWKNIKDPVINNKLQITVYRIVQEQVNNSIKHSNAQKIYIILQQTKRTLQLIIKDNGDGFDSLKIRKGVGLLNINTRAEIHNGKMLLCSQPGKGCKLTVTFPI